MTRNVAIGTYFPVLSVEGVPESIKLTLCMKSCDIESSRRIICAVSKRMDMYKTHYILPYIRILERRYSFEGFDHGIFGTSLSEPHSSRSRNAL